MNNAARITNFTNNQNFSAIFTCGGDYLVTITDGKPSALQTRPNSFSPWAQGALPLTEDEALALSEGLK